MTWGMIEKVFLRGTFTALTGLRIGGSEQGLSASGLDGIVARHALLDEPFLPARRFEAECAAPWSASTALPEGAAATRLLLARPKIRRTRSCSSSAPRPKRRRDAVARARARRPAHEPIRDAA